MQALLHGGPASQDARFGTFDRIEVEGVFGTVVDAHIVPVAAGTTISTMCHDCVVVPERRCTVLVCVVRGIHRAVGGGHQQQGRRITAARVGR